MNLFLVFAVALALAMDAFAVSVGISSSLETITKRQTLRLALHFGFFQFMMPLVGWYSTQNILGRYIEPFDHWVAFSLLVLVGGKMIHESFKRGKKIKNIKTDPTRGISLLVLALATSIDALAVGLSLAALQVAILYPAIVIGLVAFFMTVLGVKIGPFLGRLVGKRAGLLGGLILILIGVKTLLDHL
ncbi:MAG TPA: manganese efflux pump [Candidatus Aminicenantes bacterium]|nr:manganese efflux pump [Candidatus Aminicenantes bacterium]